jgi:hypothetical protein
MLTCTCATQPLLQMLLLLLLLLRETEVTG